MDRPEEIAVRALTLLGEGLSQRQVAIRLGINQSTVSRILNRFRETGSNHRRPGQGRPRVTTVRDDRFITISALRQRFQTSLQLRNELQTVRNVAISRETVRRRLREANLTPRRPATGPFHTRQHRIARLQFSRQYAHWTIPDWRVVLFGDESRIALHSPDGRVRVLRRPGERFAACNISPRVAFGGASVMVWAGVSLEARTELHIINRGSLTAMRYVTDILEEYVMPFAPYIGENFLYLHDNARPHTAGIVNDYCQEVGINLLPLPARSPDLNPIEHVWDMLKRRIRARNNAPTTVAELQNALIEEWENIDQEDIARVIQSMPRRLEAVRLARGGVTRY